MPLKSFQMMATITLCWNYLNSLAGSNSALTWDNFANFADKRELQYKKNPKIRLKIMSRDPTPYSTSEIHDQITCLL